MRDDTEVDQSDVRYAIYFAPEPGSELERLGRGWLGRDTTSGASLHPPKVPGFTDAQITDLTEPPRGYGFHGTLKPPFRLAKGTNPADLKAQLKTFTARRRSLTIPPLKVDDIDGFIALMPEEPCPELKQLAADCVQGFDTFRAAPEDAELDRRRRSGLTAEQDDMLLTWGYPYVMDEFRFHVTLTGRIEDAERRAALQRYLNTFFAPACGKPVPVHSLALFVQTGRQSAFFLETRFPFLG